MQIRFSAVAEPGTHGVVRIARSAIESTHCECSFDWSRGFVLMRHDQT